MILSKQVIVFFLICLFSFSCQVRRAKNSDFAVVDLEQKYSKPQVTKINSDENVYGPVSENTLTGEKEGEVNPIVALDFAPALYNSLGYIELLSHLERKSIRPKVIITSGFSLLVASLYAKYQSTNRVNFKMFELMGKLQKTDGVFSKDWLDEVASFLEKEFKNSTIESLPTLVVIPKYEQNNLKIVYSGNIKENIMASLSLNKSRENFLIRPSINYRPEVKKLGIDFYYQFSALGDKVSFNRPSGFLLGVYSKIRGFSKYKPHGFEEINLNNNTIDNIPNIVDLMRVAKSNSFMLSEKIITNIDEWKKR